MSYLESYVCSACGRSYAINRVQTVCACGAPLMARYDLARLGREVTPAALRDRPETLWRYRDLLPIDTAADPVSLGEGITQIVPLPRVGAALGLRDLTVKDEGSLPTGTFKARGAAVALTALRALSVTKVALASSGNAAEAWAIYGARSGVRVHLALPRSADRELAAACAAAGAELHLIDGTLADASAWVASEARARGWFNATAMREPYRLEGKKTLGFEIAEESDWRLPEVIAYPTGGGLGIIGMRKAFDELRAMGWIGRGTPRFVVAQPAGCAPVVTALAKGSATCERWGEIRTLTLGQRNQKPFADRLLLDAVRDSGGFGVAVSDGEMVAVAQSIHKLEGIQVGLEGAGAIAALGKLRRDGKIDPDDRVLAVNTSSGLKYRHLFAERAADTLRGGLGPVA